MDEEKKPTPSDAGDENSRKETPAPEPAAEEPSREESPPEEAVAAKGEAAEENEDGGCYFNKEDSIAFAKHFKLTAEDLS